MGEEKLRDYERPAPPAPRAAHSVGDVEPASAGVEPERQPLLSVSLTVALGAAALLLELAATRGHHRTLSVAYVLEAYAVLLGAPAFLSGVAEPITDEMSEAAKRRRHELARIARWPWRKSSVLRRVGSWLIVIPIVWAFAVSLERRLPAPPPTLVGVAIACGLLIGVAGWIGAVIPKSWVEDPHDQPVVTLRRAIAHEDAPAIGGTLAALAFLLSIALQALHLYRVWRF
jgi:hypothetical protein